MPVLISADLSTSGEYGSKLFLSSCHKAMIILVCSVQSLPQVFSIVSIFLHCEQFGLSYLPKYIFTMLVVISVKEKIFVHLSTMSY